MNKEHLGGSFLDDVKKWEKKHPDFKQRVQEHIEKRKLAAMLKEMRKLGTKTPDKELEAKLVGGANMFPRLAPTVNIGKRNIEAAKGRLKELRIPIIAEETGKDFGRTIIFSLEDGSIEVTIAGGKLLKRI